MMLMEGIDTLIPFHERVMADPDFVLGNFDTHYLDRFAQRRADAGMSRVVK